MNYKFFIFGLILIAAATISLIFTGQKPATIDPAIPQENVTLSGTYLCLPHLDKTGPQTEECAFGFQTDDGVFYAVNFGQSADAMQQFQNNAHVTATGFIVAKEALSTDQWQKYDMQGIFTILGVAEVSSSTPPVQGKLNIREVCNSALAYMTFPDAAAADVFIAECIDGKHPEVVERYKADMGLGDGAAI